VTEGAGSSAQVRGYGVFREVEPGRWRLIGDVDHRPGLRAEAARAQAVQDVTDGTAGVGEVCAVVLRSEWRTPLRR
jgi:hypothetical protein